jgi:hypothetical protein
LGRCENEEMWRNFERNWKEIPRNSLVFFHRFQAEELMECLMRIVRCCWIFCCSWRSCLQKCKSLLEFSTSLKGRKSFKDFPDRRRTERLLLVENNHKFLHIFAKTNLFRANPRPWYI